MDPQKLSQLDPKLREAYQRVMGTTIPEPPATPSQTQTSIPPNPDAASNPQPQPQLTPPPVNEPVPTIPTQPTPPSTPESEPASPTPPITEPQPTINPQPQSIPNPSPQSIPTQPNTSFVQMNSEIPTAQTANPQNFIAPPAQAQVMALKKKNKITPILFGFLGLIFLVIYTIFWAKILNFKLPFPIPFLQ